MRLCETEGRFAMLEMNVTELKMRRSDNNTHNTAIAGSVAQLAESVNLKPIETIRKTMLTLVRQDGRDLTARQLTALLSVYLTDETQTVTSLANTLNVSRPGVTRILDRLVDADLVSRAEDRQDRRRVLIRRTVEGLRYVEQLAGIAASAAQDVH
jgi:DNA-binding MarR family transcriptional regulator